MSSTCPLAVAGVHVPDPRCGDCPPSGSLRIGEPAEGVASELRFASAHLCARPAPDQIPDGALASRPELATPAAEAARGLSFSAWTVVWFSSVALTAGGELLHLGDRLVGMGGIGKESLVGGVGQQIEFFQDRLANEDLVTQHQSLFQRVTAEDIQDHGLRHVHSPFAATGVFSDTLAAHAAAEFLEDLRRNHTTDRTGIHQGIRLVTTDFFGRNAATTSQCLVPCVGKTDLHSNLADDRSASLRFGCGTSGAAANGNRYTRSSVHDRSSRNRERSLDASGKSSRKNRPSMKPRAAQPASPRPNDRPRSELWPAACARTTSFHLSRGLAMSGAGCHTGPPATLN